MANNKTRAKNLKGYKGVNPRKAKKERPNNKCPVCGAPIQMVTGKEMNFRFMTPETENKLYWRCSNYPHCDTYIAADPRTKQPSGILAGPSLRHKRMCIHHWEEMFVKNGLMTKPVFRQMCASQIGLYNQGVFHTRTLTEMECDTVLSYLQKLYENRKDVHDLVEAGQNSTMWKQVRGLNTAPNHGVYYNSDGSISAVTNAEK